MAGSTLTEVTTLGDVMLGAAGKFPQRDALVLPRQRITHDSLRREAYRIARALIAMGVRRGEHVGLLIPNCCEFAEALFGITLIGAVAVPLNVRLKAPEIGYIL